MTAYALQDSIGRFVTYYNRGYVMDTVNPKLYKSAAKASTARARLKKFYNLRIVKITLEVNNDYVYRPTKASFKDIRGNGKDQSTQGRQTRVEETCQSLPVGIIQN